MLTEAVSLYNITAGRADVRTPKPSCCLQLSPLSDVFQSVLQPGMKVWAVPAPLQTCLCACGATPVPTKSWKPEATSPVLLLQLGCWKEKLDSLGDWAHNPLILLPTALSHLGLLGWGLELWQPPCIILTPKTKLSLEVFYLFLTSIRLIGVFREHMVQQKKIYFIEMLLCGLNSWWSVCYRP